MKTVSPLICRQFVLVIVMDGFKKYATWLFVVVVDLVNQRELVASVV